MANIEDPDEMHEHYLDNSNFDPLTHTMDNLIFIVSQIHQNIVNKPKFFI